MRFAPRTKIGATAKTHDEANRQIKKPRMFSLKGSREEIKKCSMVPFSILPKPLIEQRKRPHKTVFFSFFSDTITIALTSLSRSMEINESKSKRNEVSPFWFHCHTFYRRRRKFRLRLWEKECETDRERWERVNGSKDRSRLNGVSFRRK